jgi:hypothetical protein
MRSRIALGLAVPVVALMAAGCATSDLVDTWRDPAFTSAPMQNVFVVAMKKDAAQRRLWEDAFVAELRKHGVRATPSYRRFPNAVPDTSQVLAALARDRFDGVLVSHKLETEFERHYVPGYTTVEPVTGYSPSAGRYVSYLARVREPGYVDTDRVERYQIDMWAAATDGRPVWTATSESVDPTSNEAVNREIARLIVPELAREALVPRKS